MLVSFRYFLFLMLYNKERSLGCGESDPYEYSRLLTCEKSGLELGLTLAAGPLGNLAAERKMTGQKI